MLIYKKLKQNQYLLKKAAGKNNFHTITPANAGVSSFAEMMSVPSMTSVSGMTFAKGS